MDDRRRAFVKSIGIAAACGAGLLRPAGAWAAWNQQAFDAKSLDSALAALGVGGATRSSVIAIDAPEFAENGAFVPVEIRSDAPGTQTIALFVERNPWPYIARFDVSKGALSAVALRIRVAETAPVRVVVTAGGKHFYAAKEVKVTAGGCADGGGADPGKATDKAEPMKLRARLAGEVAEVRVLMAHPMENGLRRDAADKPIREHFIRNVTARLDGRTVFEAEFGRSVSANPLLVFKVRGAKAGDKLAVTWEDNRGLARSDEASVSAG